ncbi:MAG TPA: hypothetical protein PKA41_07290 [Verrucomicrobiota bacterium]|nr:hypothetical protein [Verrucomicrobiota bacterium]
MTRDQMRILLPLIAFGLLFNSQPLRAQESQKCPLIVLTDFEADPEGDNLGFLWFHYPETSFYKAPIKTDSAENVRVVFIKATIVEKTEATHFILKVTGKGTPPLTRYRRVIVDILPDRTPADRNILTSLFSDATITTKNPALQTR